MVLVQDILRMLKILVVHRAVVPGQVQKRLQVGPHDIAFLAAAGHGFQPGDLLPDARLHFLRRFQLLHLLGELVRVGQGGVVPQLLAQKLHLLPQDIVSLVLVQISLQLLLELTADLIHRDLPGQLLHEHGIQLVRRIAFQQRLRRLPFPVHVCGSAHQQPVHGRDPEEGLEIFVEKCAVSAGILVQPVPQDTDHRHGHRSLRIRLDQRLGDILAFQHVCRRDHRSDTDTLHAFDHDPPVFLREPRHLADLAERAVLEQAVSAGIQVVRIFLGDKQHLLVVQHRILQRRHGLSSAYVKVLHPARQDHQTAQGDNGHFFPASHSFFSIVRHAHRRSRLPRCA